MSAISASEKVDGFTRKSMRKAQKQRKSQGSSQYRTQSVPVELSPLPQLKDAPSTEQQELFTQKLQQCCMLFDFFDSVMDLKSKEIKRATLNELVDYVSTNRGVLVESTYPEITNMVLVVAGGKLTPHRFTASCVIIEPTLVSLTALSLRSSPFLNPPTSFTLTHAHKSLFPFPPSVKISHMPPMFVILPQYCFVFSLTVVIFGIL